MTTVELLVEIQKVLVLATVPAAIGFPIWYHLKLRWYDSEMGRHVMGYSTVVALLYLTTLVRMFFPRYPGQLYTATALAALMGVVIWWRVLVFVHLRREARQKQDEDRKPSQEK